MWVGCPIWGCYESKDLSTNLFICWTMYLVEWDGWPTAEVGCVIRKIRMNFVMWLIGFELSEVQCLNKDVWSLWINVMVWGSTTFTEYACCKLYTYNDTYNFSSKPDKVHVAAFTHIHLLWYCFLLSSCSHPPAPIRNGVLYCSSLSPWPLTLLRLMGDAVHNHWKSRL